MVYGVSASNWPLYDLEHGKRAVGYFPQQVAEMEGFEGNRMDPADWGEWGAPAKL